MAEGSTLEESSSNCIRLEWNKGIVGHVAATGQPLNIKNAYEVKTRPVLFSLTLVRVGVGAAKASNEVVCCVW